MNLGDVLGLATPMGGNTAQQTGWDELGNPIYRTQFGHSYSVGPQGQPHQPERIEDVLKLPKDPRDPMAIPKALLGGVVGSVANGFTAPGRALAGESMTLGDVLDTAGLAMIGSSPSTTPKGALRSGLSRQGAAGEIMAQNAGKHSNFDAYHTTSEPFDRYDWSRLGRLTKENTAGTGVETWASNLAELGPWSSSAPLGKRMGGIDLPVSIGGKGKEFQSLDALEKFIRKNGGPVEARKKLTASGYGHLKVADEEFGGTSFVSLTPETFSVSRAAKD